MNINGISSLTALQYIYIYIYIYIYKHALLTSKDGSKSRNI